MNPHKLELLAPAKNLEYGIAAIDCGADAVYIGARKFGARSAAGNPVEDIAALVRYSRPFGVKVYVALNTVLFDGELDEARDTAVKAWEAGADALIVQDMAYAAMELPPMPLFASTQTFNMLPEKVKFLEDAGFSRVILERALSLDEIRDIRSKTTIELETFVHGAICVCYSGQCYMSHAISGRSGNRGECAQPCRWDYDLTDAAGRIIECGKHLLSVRDLDLSDSMGELIDAGITSFKIEGRLKEISYLRNIVSHYRQKLDASGYSRTSYGESVHDFTPDPGRSFSRGSTSYYLHDKNNRVASFETPKSIGQPVGVVESISRDSFIINGDTVLTGGDGISFFTSTGHTGTNINRVDGSRVFPNRIDGIAPGMKIYRNHDHLFVKRLEKSRTRRIIPVDIVVGPCGVRFTDSEGFSVEAALDFEPAKDAAKARETIIKQLSKTGDTIYSVRNTDFSGEPGFASVSALNDLRRRALEELTDVRVGAYRRETRRPPNPGAIYPEKHLDYTGNVTNRLAEQFYKSHGVESINKGFESTFEHAGKTVMRTRYCIQRERGCCGKTAGRLFLVNKNNRFELKFDCSRCEMSVVYE